MEPKLIRIPIENVFARRLARTANNLLHAYGLNTSETGVEDRLANLEHLIHELIHTQLLDLPFDEHASYRISRQFDMAGIDSVDHEERTLAVGWLIWRELDLPLDLAYLKHLVEDQEVSQRRVLRLIKTKTISKQARRALRSLKILSNMRVFERQFESLIYHEGELVP